ncbi:MAG: cadherin-like domain-containing protein, partial [Pseudomonadota bacterium]
MPAASEGVLTFVRGGARVTAVPGEVLSQAELSTLQFEPAADFSGPVTPFVYTLTGTNGGVSDPATVTITVDGVPDLADDTVTVQEDVATALSPLDNDPDVVGDGPATLALTSAPPAGQGELSYTDAGGATVVVDPTALPSGLTAAEFNTLTFTPAPDYNGPVDPVTYTVTDADGDVESATIRIAIDAAPDAGDDTIAATEDTPVAVDVLGNDEGGDGLAGVTFAAVPDPAVGTLTYTDASGASQPVVAGVELTPAEAASLLFTPAPDVSGPVPPFTYTLRDVDGDVSAPATVSITVDGIPDLADDLVSIAEDETVLLDPLANDADPVGDGPASVAITAIPAPGEGTLSYTADAGGTVTIGAGDLPAGLSATEAATLTFTPAPAYNGPVTPITYTVTDADGDVERATIRVEIAATVDAVNDAVTTPEGSPVALAPLANDDPGGPGASVTIDTAPPASQGTLTYVDATGTLQTVDPAVLPATLTPAEFNTLTFTPAADYQGPVDPIGYTITDPDGGARDSAAISILVDGLPEAVDDVVAGEEDTPLALDIVANDDLGDGVAAFTLDSLPPAAEGLLTYVDATTGAVTPVTAGAPLTPAEAATLTFTPAADFNGPVTDIPYTLTDADGDTSSATLSISIDAAPDAVADLVETPEDTQAAIPLLDNDGFDAADLATVTVTAPAAGFGALTYTDATGSSVTLTPGAATDLTPGEAATLAFAPAPDVTGAVPAIPYTLTDLDGDSSDALISILIVPTPDAVPETIATDEEAPVALDLTSNDDTGAGLDRIRLDTVPPATEGTLTYTDAAGTLQTVDPASPPTLTPAEAASLVFTPAPDFSGTATPIGYTLFDTNGAADSSQAVITVNGVPDLTDDIFSTPSDTSIDLDILANDVDFGDGIDTVTLDALPPAAEGVLTYETVPGDASTRTDAVAGTPLTAAQADTLAFDPDPAFFGAVTPVTYTVTDTTGDSATATLSGSVAADVNAATDSYLTDPDLVITEGTTQPLGLLANDRFNDPDSTVTLAGLPPASEGTLTYTDAAGTVIAIDPAAPPVLPPGEAATLAFTPADGFGGAVTPFTYTITAPDGTTDSAAVELFVDLLPEARPDSFAIEEGGTADLSTLISGGTEEDDRGDGPVTLAITAPPAAQGTLSYETVPGDASTRTDIPAGATEAGLTEAQAATLAFAATPEFAGPVDPIAYTITDADGDSSATTVSIAVDPAPDATSEAVTVAEDTPTPIDIFANETDPGSGLAAVTFTGIPDPATVGILTVLDDPTDPASARPLTEGDVLTPAQAATLTFVPVENFDGAVPPVSYTLTDTDGDVSDPATLTLTVDAAPEALPDLFTVDEDGGPVAINPLANDDGDPGTPQGDTGSPGPNTPTVTLTAPAAAQGTLTYTADAGGTVTAAPGAPLTLSATEAQSLAFTPAPDFDGTVAIDYTVTDGDAADPESASATLRIAVNPIPDPVADLVATDEDTPVALGILPGDDVGDGIATVDILSLPDPADGTLTYTDATGATQTLTAPASLSAAEANTLTFTPAPDVTTAGRPPVSFTYTLTDTTADTATPTPVNITIEA